MKLTADSCLDSTVVAVSPVALEFLVIYEVFLVDKILLSGRF